MTRLTDLGVVDAVEAIRRHDTSATELLDASLARIEALEPSLRAWAFIDTEGTRAFAAALDGSQRRGESLGPLHGVPLGVKDIIDVAGMPTRSGAAAFAHTEPTDDAPLVARLRQAGAIIVGKTVATQFAYRDPPPTRNPWDAARTPGGSSSGSAAAVAARMIPGAIGTQTVGSILRPAAYCGVVGLKGRYGSVPLDGVVPLATSLDHGGPIARSVADAVALLSVMADVPITAPGPVAPRIGVSEALLGRAAPVLREHLDDVLDRARKAGAIVRRIDLPEGFDRLAAAGQVILETEAAAFHRATFADHAADYAPTIRALIEAGLARGDAELAAALRTRADMLDALRPILADHDAVLLPVAPDAAPPFEEGTGDGRLCAPASTLGVPAISLPSGVSADGLPFAIQLMGGPDRLEPLLSAAAWMERALGFEAAPSV